MLALPPINPWNFNKPDNYLLPMVVEKANLEAIGVLKRDNQPKAKCSDRP